MKSFTKRDTIRFAYGSWETRNRVLPHWGRRSGSHPADEMTWGDRLSQTLFSKQA
jgi:hypothetical protein